MWGEDRGPTIPQPFHFATMDRGGSGAAGEGAAGEAAPALSQRALLRMILEDGEESAGGAASGAPAAAAAPGGRAAAAAAPASSPHNVTLGLGAWDGGEGGVDITRM